MESLSIGLYGISIKWDGIDKRTGVLKSNLEAEAKALCEDPSSLTESLSSIEITVLCDFCAEVDICHDSYLRGIQALFKSITGTCGLHEILESDFDETLLSRTITAFSNRQHELLDKVNSVLTEEISNTITEEMDSIYIHDDKDISAKADRIETVLAGGTTRDLLIEYGHLTGKFPVVKNN